VPADDGVLFVGYDAGMPAELAAALGTSVVCPPPVPTPPLVSPPAEPVVAEVSPPGPPAGAGGGWSWSPAVAEWGDELRAGDRVGSVVVCTWDAGLDRLPGTPLVGLGPEAWRQRVELPLAVWFTAVVAAAERCDDGGSVVVVVELPAALDSHGRADVTAVAEGTIALARSAALVHGERSVRVNVVATEIATAPANLTGMAPALPTFPGRIAHEIAGAVRLLSGSDAAGVTGTVLRADCGRAW
jgi:NAD(P)-dependent dehydrogenase (short-subunit alcohol dehydrogenase family)